MLNPPAWIYNNVMGKSWRLPALFEHPAGDGSGCHLAGFCPLNLGGQVSYVMVNGISMEPGFHTGDLAIMRQAADYQVGDIVTYRNAHLNANVIHRIIGVEGDHFVFKGDNNSWFYAYRPTQAELVGKLWLHLAQVGKVENGV